MFNLKWTLVIICLGCLFACGDSDLSTLEKRVALLENTPVNIPHTEKVVTPTSIDWAKWASTLATLSAVLTSLFLANRDRLIRLVLETQCENGDIHIWLTNIGRRDAVIKSIRIYSRFSKKDLTCIIEDEDGNNLENANKSNKKLEDGDRKPYKAKDFLSKWNKEKKSFNCFKKILFKIKLVPVVAEVQVSTGKKFSKVVRYN